MTTQLYVSEDQKILISDLLFFLQNKLQSIPNDDIVKLCNNFYNDDYVWQEKERFYLAIGMKPIKSRSLDKKTKDLNGRNASAG